NPDAPICVLTPLPDEPDCRSDDDARNWVIIINQFACSGQCDLGAVELRMGDNDRNLISWTTAFDIDRPSTRTVSFGTRFTGEGAIFEAAFTDQSFVMSAPIALSAPDHGITRLRTVSVTFRSGRTALISFSFTPYRARP
ncbi:MAG: hypothetical protein KDE05_12270, partial [Parvularculaceae bacterium]|nr:hypothetical protein [Parvularculaceae bacterium]